MNVIDLFCGCGGFSLGFSKAGFNIKYAIDNWKGCKETYEYNHPETEFILSDIQDLDPHDFEGKVDIVIGSPPCQEFSKANSNPNIDKGLVLVKEYLRWIKVLQPKYWIMENVPGVVKFLNRKDFKILKIVNCADYGIPQKRIRCFAGNYFVPEQTHSRYVQTDLFGNKLEKWMTVREALKVKDVNQELDFVPYSQAWIDKHPPIKIDQPSHTITSKNDNLYVKYYDSPYYPSGYKSGRNPSKLDQPANTIMNFGRDPKMGLIEVSSIINDVCFDNLKTSQYEHSHRVIEKEDSSVTITTKMRCNNKIQDKQLFRRLSVRECAILQSFPLDFIFHGSLSNQYLMVGNAVPPRMSYLLANEIKKRIN